LKATVLVGSLVLSLGAWGSFLDLGSAFAITIVLLVHEAGHALAMRWLGWRDVSMFFIPLFGGLATGRASDPAAWKRVVVLLAGPLPGLVAGFLGLWLVMFHPAFVPADWKPFTLLLAAMAVVVNLANLLPLSPLDGGRLVEMAVFSRWPRARALFVALGVVIMAIAAVMLRDGFLGVLAVMLLAWLPGQWRIATLHAQVQATPAGSFQPQALGTLVATKFAKLPLLQQFGVLHGLVDAFRVPKPGHWERAVAIGVMVVVWSVGAGVAIKYDLLRHARTSLSDSRTAAQRAFDEALDAYDDEEAGPADQQLARLLDRAAGLPSEDPRRVDAQVAQALHQPPGARRDALGPIIAAGHDGQRWSVSGLISSELAQVEAKALELPPDEALARMEEGLSWATGLAPHRLEPTIHLRLRMMEALDRQGREDEVGAALGDLRAKVAAANDCRCSAHAVISAQAWHRIHHDDPQGALKVIDEGLPTVAASGHRALQRDRAWALLLDAQAQQGLTQMQEAVSVKTARGSISYGSWGMDLIYAMDAAGKEAQAHTLLKEMPEWTCDAAKSRDRGEIESVAPWQGRRQALLQDIGTRYCPAAGR
jgi:Zn-dependent protease